jgi:CheY-like chemotaxis protein
MPRKVLTLGIADDMLIDQTLIEHHIKAIKNTTVLFRSGNGRELLYKLRHYNLDILIIDLYMPIMSGWKVLAELKKLDYAGDIIFTTCG